jgi:lactate dehydrogenase-like 2-hydroxyacid dehydrogenase
MMKHIRAAIKACCLQCTGLDRVEVANCQAAVCALFEYRHYQPRATKQEGAQE